jgi:hypothetical protein
MQFVVQLSKHGCKSGYYGNACLMQCGSNCDGNACDFATGACSGTCASGKYGDYCDLSCLIHCQSIADNVSCHICYTVRDKCFHSNQLCIHHYKYRKFVHRKFRCNYYCMLIHIWYHIFRLDNFRLLQGHVVAHALVVNMVIIATYLASYIVLLKYARKMAELVHLYVKRDITEVIVIYLVPHPVQQMNEPHCIRHAFP